MTLVSAELLGIILPALAAGMVVAATHVPLGQEVLRRGIIFIDLAIAQIAALGVVAGHVVFLAEGGFLPPSLAFAFALAGGGLFAWLEKVAPTYQEAFIGSAFVISASLILILLANHPHGGEEMESLLAGQILWADWPRIGLTALISLVVLAIWFRRRESRPVSFYFLFPVVVTFSVQLVGVYLVFASLILPALGAACFEEKKQLAAGYIIAVGALMAGLAASVMADLPAGPVLVCFYALGALGALFLKNLRA